MKNLYILSILFLSLCFFSCEDSEDEPKRGIEITSVSPLEGQVRDVITITGKNFKPINTNVVLFADGIVAKIVSFSETEIKALVPDSGVVNGPIKVRVGVNEIATSSQSFTIDKSKPVIISLTPGYGLAGTEILIKGANFSKTGNKVFFGTQQAEIVKESEYRITVKLPQGLPDGEVDVVIESNGVKSAPAGFEVGIIYRDDFNRAETEWADKNVLPNPIGTNWFITNGAFQIKEQYLNVKSSGNILYQANGAIMNSGNGHSFKLSADFRIDIAAGTCFAGILFNAQDAEKYYLLRMNGDGLVQFLATADGGISWPGVFYSSMHAIPGGDSFYHAEISSDTPGTFSMKITNQNGDILFDQQLSDPQARYSNGYAGFWSLDDHSQFDNFSLLLK